MLHRVHAYFSVVGDPDASKSYNAYRFQYYCKATITKNKICVHANIVATLSSSPRSTDVRGLPFCKCDIIFIYILTFI
jgi:hypothetical protein